MVFKNLSEKKQLQFIFGDCAELVKLKAKPSDNPEARYIGLEHIDQNSLQLNGYGYARDVHSQKTAFKKGDILFGKLRPYFRKVVVAPFDGVCSTDIWAIRPKSSINRDFLFYWMASLDFIDSVTNASEGTRMPRAKWEFAAKLTLSYKSTSEQKEIGETLRMLDNRITLLRESNTTLESIAKAAFKSWFVDFDPVRVKHEGRVPQGMDSETALLFPNTLEESELGLIPKGWKYVSLKDAVAIFDSQRVPLANNERVKRKGVYPYYGAATLMDHVNDYIFNGIYLLLGEDGSVTDSTGYPIMQYVWGKIWVNNHAHVLQGKNGISTEHIMLALKRTNIQPYITGAVQAKLSQSNMWHIPFLMPPASIAKSFGKFIEPLFNRIRHNSEQALTLTSLRDILLPRLISGQLRIPEQG